MKALLNDKFEQVFLDKWSHAKEVPKGNKWCNGYPEENKLCNVYPLGIINVMWPYIMEYGPLTCWGVVKGNNIIIRRKPLEILRIKYKMWVLVYYICRVLWFVLYKDGLWSDSFYKE